jgi:hypothetical protein
MKVELELALHIGEEKSMQMQDRPWLSRSFSECSLVKIMAIFQPIAVPYEYILSETQAYSVPLPVVVT